MTENPKYRPNFFKFHRKHTKLGSWTANLKLCANIRKKFKKLFTLKIIVIYVILKTVLNSSEIKTAGLLFRIFSDTVGQTAMMWDKIT